MTDSEYQTVVVGSGDLNAIQGSNASSFSVTLAEALRLPGRWEVAISNINFPKATVGRSVFVYCDFVDAINIGSSPLQMLYKARPTTSADPDPRYEEVQSSIVPWKKVIRKEIDSMTFTLADSTGAKIPTGANKFTTIELVFRQISDSD